MTGAVLLAVSAALALAALAANPRRGSWHPARASGLARMQMAAVVALTAAAASAAVALT